MKEEKINMFFKGVKKKKTRIRRKEIKEKKQVFFIKSNSRGYILFGVEGD